MFDDLHDIVLDVPNAYHTLSKFVERGAQAGFVTRVVAEQLPSRCVCVRVRMCVKMYKQACRLLSDM